MTLGGIMIELNQKGEETKKHGNAEISLGVYDVSLGGMEASIKAHWHREMEVILVTSGSFQLQVNTKVYKCQEGDIIFINPEELHYFTAIESIYATWKALVFDIAQLHAMLLDRATLYFIKPIMNGINKCKTIVSPDNEVHKQLDTFFREILHVYEERKYGFELEIKALMLRMMSTLYRGEYVREQVNNNVCEQQVGKIKEVIDYIGKHYVEQITIDELAALCHYNTEYFMRFFKKHTGTTCGQFIKIYRLEQAAYLLQTTTKPITQIALDAGFANISYFIRSFKAYYHTTPKEFRKHQTV